MDVIQNRQTYKLPDDFLEPFKDKKPSMSVPAYVTTLRTYAAKVEGENRVEEWWEICRRVVEGAFSFLKWHVVENQIKSFDWAWWDKWAKVMFTRMFEMKWTPAGRGLQHMGRDVVWKKGGAVLNSCGFISTKDIDSDFAYPFLFLMDMSMLGVGMGFDVRGAGTANIIPPRISPRTLAVEDTREGWLAVMRELLAAFSKEDDKGLPRTIDFRGVRPEGAPLTTMGGVASGPGPLIRLVWDVIEVLAKPEWRYTVHESEDGLVLTLGTESEWWTFEHAESEYPIDSVQIGDLMNIAGKCVVSGGIRRSAEIGLAPIEDWRFRNLKSTKVGISSAWQESHRKRYGFAPETRNDAWRWAANNSHVLDEPLTWARAKEIAESVVEKGDPGIFNRYIARTHGRLIDGRDDRDFMVEGCNPCGEQPLEDGELCNLVETVPVRHSSTSDFAATAYCALIYGKIVSLIPTHVKSVNDIIRRNRRIGVSQTGVFLAFQELGAVEYARWCDLTYKAMKSLDSNLSSMLKVAQSIRITSLKPSGTVSKVLDVPSGLRADEAPFYILRIQFDKTSPLIVPLRLAGYPIEQSLQSPNAVVVEFPVTTGCSRGVADVSAVEQLEMIEVVQTYWSDNMVSNTVQFTKGEVESLPSHICYYGNKLKSLSFLSYDGHTFKQAPYEAISKEEYDGRVSSLLPIDFSLMGSNNVHDQDDKFCEGVACSIL